VRNSPELSVPFTGCTNFDQKVCGTYCSRTLERCADETITIISDMSAQMRRENDLARRDELTKLLNRAGLHKWSEMYFKPAEYKIAAFTFDVRGLKPLNDKFGHDAGDLALVMFAAALHEIVQNHETLRLRVFIEPENHDPSDRRHPEVDAIARFGGDEFVMCLPMPGLSDEEIYGTLHGISNSIECLAIKLDEHRHAVTCRHGLALSSETELGELREVLKLADLRMTSNKQLERENHRRIDSNQQTLNF
jgi:GGDEF domain-containing protein